ncbi:hypothetical protein IMG5_058280, partial [Ichthyophthirius multifiliis]
MDVTKSNFCQSQRNTFLESDSQFNLNDQEQQIQNQQFQQHQYKKSSNQQKSNLLKRYSLNNQNSEFIIQNIFAKKKYFLIFQINYLQCVFVFVFVFVIVFFFFFNDQFQKNKQLNRFIKSVRIKQKNKLYRQFKTQKSQNLQYFKQKILNLFNFFISIFIYIYIYFNASKGVIEPKNPQNTNIQNYKKSNQYLVQNNQSNKNDYIESIIKNINQSKGGLNEVWKKRSFRILAKINYFILRIKQFSLSLKFKSFTQKQFQLINDKSSNYEFFKLIQYNQKNIFIYTYQKIIYNIKKSINVYLYKNFKVFKSLKISKNIQIQPNSYIKNSWDLLTFILIFFNLFYIPLVVCFQEEKIIAFQTQISLLKYFFSIDIPIQMITPYYSKGQIVQEKSKIFKKYVQKNFILDFLTSLGFIASFFLQINWINYVIIFKIKRMINIYREIEQRLNLRYKYSTFLDLTTLVYYIIIVAHICGCHFFLVGILQKTDLETQTWIMAQQLDEQNLQTKYITSVYWAVITMITLGYGDVVPITNIEKIYVTFVTIISCGVFAYIVNTIGSIIQDINKNYQEFQHNVSQLSGYLTERGVNNNLIVKIKKNFEYLYKEQVKKYEVHQSLLDNLNSTLKKEVQKEIYYKILLQQKFFKLNFTDDFIKELATHIKQKNLMPEEVVFDFENINQNLYFIIKGQIQIYVDSNNSPKLVQVFEKGKIFSQNSLFNSEPSIYKAVSKNVANLAYLNQQDFIQVIKAFPQDYEKYCMIKDQYNINQVLQNL